MPAKLYQEGRSSALWKLWDKLWEQAAIRWKVGLQTYHDVPYAVKWQCLHLLKVRRNRKSLLSSVLKIIPIPRSAPSSEMVCMRVFYSTTVNVLPKIPIQFLCKHGGQLRLKQSDLGLHTWSGNKVFSPSVGRIFLLSAQFWLCISFPKTQILFQKHRVRWRPCSCLSFISSCFR